jgi:hypothetical protein
LSRTYKANPEAHEGYGAWRAGSQVWSKTHRGRREGEVFRCRHCRLMVAPPASGGRHRNHCPYCLYSRHVDGKTPGDRASECGGSMAPTGAFTRPNGEYVVVHRCLACSFERHNRIAADDNFVLVLGLPRLKPRLPK